MQILKEKDLLGKGLDSKSFFKGKSPYTRDLLRLVLTMKVGEYLEIKREEWPLTTPPVSILRNNADTYRSPTYEDKRPLLEGMRFSSRTTPQGWLVYLREDALAEERDRELAKATLEEQQEEAAEAMEKYRQEA